MVFALQNDMPAHAAAKTFWKSEVLIKLAFPLQLLSEKLVLVFATDCTLWTQ